MTDSDTSLGRLAIKGLLSDLSEERRQSIAKTVGDLHAILGNLPAGADRHLAVATFLLDRAELARSEGL